MPIDFAIVKTDTGEVTFFVTRISGVVYSPVACKVNGQVVKINCTLLTLLGETKPFGQINSHICSRRQRKRWVVHHGATTTLRTDNKTDALHEIAQCVIDEVSVELSKLYA